MQSEAKRFCFFIVSWICLIGECTAQAVLLTVIGEKCVTNASSAMAAIYERQDRYWDRSEKVDEDIKYSSGNPKKLCQEFSHCYSSGDDWVKANSLDPGPINNLITDRRWEDLSMYVTKHKDEDDEKLEYLNVGIINNVDFVVPFSVQIDMQAHVFLCEGFGVSSSRCYWYLLQGWSGLKSGFRICYASEIPDIFDGHAPKGTCGSSTREYEHNEKFPRFLDGKKWSHFKIIKTGTELSLVNEHGDALMLTDVKNFLFSPRVVFFHSKEVNGLWKIHNFDYFYSTITGKTHFKLQLDSTASQCLSMFVAMCDRCFMRVIFYTNTVRYPEEILDSQSAKWREEIFCFNAVSDRLYLEVEKVKEGVSTRSDFWALSDIRTSQSNLRHLTPHSKKWTGICQFLESGSIIHSKVSPIETLGNWNKCTEYQFGEDCTPCNAVFNDQCPKKNKYCQLFNNSGTFFTKCYCSIGFENSRCDEACSHYKYGHSCRKSCENCQDGCKEHTVSGKCDGQGFCSNNYAGEKCDQPPGLFLFKNSPKFAPGYTDCKVILNSFEGQGISSEMKYYKFQYRQLADKGWEDAHKNTLKFNVPEEIVINGLQPETSYEVRVFGYTHEDDLRQLSHVIPNSYPFNTTCIELDEEQIEITPFSFSASISMGMVRDNYCKISDYQITVNGTEVTKDKGRASVNKYKTTQALDPFSPYVLVIKKDGKEIIKKIFRTQESTPTQVENFQSRTNSREQREVILNWKKPKKTNGILLYYTLSIQINYLLACHREVTQLPIEKYVNDDQETYTLTDLKPYVEYSIEIKANTSAGFGKPSAIIVQTNSVDQIKEEEIPEMESVHPDEDAVTFQFKNMDCERLMGPMTLKIKFSTAESWCTDPKDYDADVGKLFNNVTVLNLKPFCSYTASVQYSRFGRIQKDITLSFKTKEAEPNKIKELLVTSKSPSHISLKWLPPYPPTGQLEKYKISVNYNERYWNSGFSFLRTDPFSPNPCKFWEGFHCATVGNLTENYVYLLKLTSKNKGNDEYSSETEKKFQAKENKPGKPYGLKFTWTTKNHLYLEWFHPSESDGTITSFQISLNYKDVSEYEVKSENDYNATYRKTIEEILNLPNEYRVAVRARNSKGDSNEEFVNQIKSPPPLPKSSIKTIERTENSIRIMLKEYKYKKEFKRFLYILISECDSCKGSLDEFRKSLIAHHEKFEELETQIDVDQWKRYKEYIYLNQYDMIGELVISNTSEPKYIVEASMSYSVGFIWIHKHAGYVRTNLTVDYVDAYEQPEPKPTHAGKISAIISLLLLIVTVGFIFKRFKRSILKSVRDMFRIGLSDPNIIRNPVDDTSEPTYANQIEIPLIPATTKRHSMRYIRPLSVVVTEEICPGVPLFKTVYSRRVKLETLQSYVKNAIESGELKTQHEKFPRGKTKEWSYGVLPENKSKNRYQNLIAYDHTRVVLNKINGDEFSDYINANFIDGYRHPKAYIATQGPKKNTVNDFWRMIWEQKVTHIVMMANVIENNKKKTEQYWPNINEELTFGAYRVSYISSEIHANYDYRKFELQYKYSKPKQIGQLHFKVWPDHGVPLYPQSLVQFLQRMLALRSRDFPLVVHCSAGVGRTGTIILCDICLRMAAAEGYVDILSMLEHIRSQRPNMVDNIEQYKLAHLVILDCLMGLRMNIPINDDFAKSVEGIQDIDYQLKYIRECEWEDDAMKTVAFIDDEVPPMVSEKNRFPDIVPDQIARVFLHPYPAANPVVSSTYINAVQVDGFCYPGQYIVTQFPMPNTIGDFWRLVAEREISIIVCLNELPARDSTCKIFWPQKQSKLEPVDVVHVKHIKNKTMQVYSIMTFELSTFYQYQENQVRTVEIVRFHGWKYPNLVPDYTDFITLVEDVTNIARNSNQILVTCYDGATASGLFIAMTFLMEKIKLEQECDVCQAVRSIRTSRKQFTNTKEQLEFLYKASVLYVEQKFVQYSNISM